MKNIYIILFVALISTNLFAQIDRTKPPKAGPAPEINIGTGESFELKNGLKVIVVENHKLPRIAFNLVLNYEALIEGDKAGYASIAGDLLRTGTASKSKSQIDEEIDFIGATFNTSASGIYAASLSKHTDELLELFTDVLYNPSFPADELEKIRKQTLSGLATQKDDPGAIASNVRSVVLYGKDHPYGELTTEETVKNITLEDCKGYYEKYFTPEIAYLAIVGDIDLKGAKKIAKKYFGSWENTPLELPAFNATTEPASTQVAMVDRSNSVQSEIRIAYPIKLKKGDPEIVKANLMNVVLGAGFSSRLMQNLREKHAYTYGARSSISSDMIVGNWSAGTSVRNDVTDSAVHELLYEMQRIVDEEVTEKELASAKAYITGSFARSLESPQTIANFALNIQRYNLPADYYSDYLKRLNDVTLQDIQAAAKKYIRPENAHIVVVGKGAEIASKLQRFGDLTYYDIYGNEYTPAAASVPEGLTPNAVFSKYIDAIGGEQKLREIQDKKVTMKAEFQGRELEMLAINKSPNMSKQVVTMGGMEMMRSVFNGTEAKAVQMGNPAPIDDNQMKDMSFEAAIISELAIVDMGLETKIAGAENVNGATAYGVEITKPSGSKVTFYYDAETGLKIKTSETVAGPQGEMVQESELADYKEVSGVKIPHTVTIPMGPMNMVAEIINLQFNSGVEDSEFTIQ